MRTNNSRTLSASYKQSNDNCDNIIAPLSQFASLINNKNYNSRINSSQTSSISVENSQRKRVQFANVSSTAPANATDNFKILQYRLNELQKTVEELQTISNYPTVYVSFRNF